MTYLVVGYLLCVNVTAFVAMGVDKRSAQRKLARIPEKTLIGLALAGGGTGVYLGMRFFHHKTRKGMFAVGVPVVTAVEWIFFLRWIMAT